MSLLRDPIRLILWLGFFASILAAWWVLYRMSLGMGLDLLGRPGPAAEAMRRMDPRMDMAMPMARFTPLFAMWAVMMAAMMLPTMVPTLRAYEGLMRRAGEGRSGWLGLLLGYLFVWIGFAALIAAVQLGLLFAGGIDMLGIASSLWFSAALLMAVGAYQFSAAKHTCHGVCHAPVMYFLGYWRRGFTGGVRMGLGLGVYCVGCCWGFMALGYVGGVMSLLWMGLATLFMIFEKLPQIGRHLLKPAGVVLIAAGFYVAGMAAGITG